MMITLKSKLGGNASWKFSFESHSLVHFKTIYTFPFCGETVGRVFYWISLFVTSLPLFSYEMSGCHEDDDADTFVRTTSTFIPSFCYLTFSWLFPSIPNRKWKLNFHPKSTTNFPPKHRMGSFCTSKRIRKLPLNYQLAREQKHSRLRTFGTIWWDMPHTYTSI